MTLGLGQQGPLEGEILNECLSSSFGYDNHLFSLAQGSDMDSN